METIMLFEFQPRPRKIMANKKAIVASLLLQLQCKKFGLVYLVFSSWLKHGQIIN